MERKNNGNEYKMYDASVNMEHSNCWNDQKKRTKVEGRKMEGMNQYRV
jgi:hypothetical protein